MSKNNKIFDFIDAMTIKKTPVEEVDFSGYSQFIIDKLIGSSEIFIPIVHKINIRKLSNEHHYQFYKSILPKRKIYSTSIKSDAAYLRSFSAVSKYYECGTRDTEIHLKRLKLVEIDRIISIVEQS